MMGEQKGFTLIELVVAIAIFVLIIGSAMGIFVSAVRSQRKFLVIQKLLDETSYTVEYISRFLRMAKRAKTGGCISSGSNYIFSDTFFYVRFLDYHGKCHQFGWFEDSALEKIAEWVSLDETAEPSFGDPPTSPDNYLTSNKYTLEPSSKINFILAGETVDDNLQPRVTISFKISTGDDSDSSPSILLQTTISQRDLDI